MKNILLIQIFSFSIIWAQSPVVPSDDYFIHKESNVTSIYSKEYHKSLAKIRSFQNTILQTYKNNFGYTLDDTLYTGFASLNNQIANGFSTQVPFNSQLNYGAGAGYLDYFSSVSWLKLLLIHETVHNYQMNVKENPISKVAHKVLGNTPLSGIGPIPIFPIPNIFIGSFILEGNAVLNESRFGFGGRLFSGKTIAEAILLAKAGELTPEKMYNLTLDYPYGNQFYLVGGLFQAYLADKYGLKKVNGFFKAYSKQYLPFYLNDTFQSYYGKDFETLFSEFKHALLEKHQGFVKTETNILTHSQTYIPLTRLDDRIITLTSDIKSAPNLWSISTNGNNIHQEKTSLPSGQVFQYKNKYYTQSTRYTSPFRITQGLYDSGASLLKQTDSKVIQGFMPDGKMVYMDIRKSLEYPHIYIDGVFYDTAHSRVYVDIKGNLYYFKQKGKNRVLYKNKKSIFSFEGYESIIADVDNEDSIYFVAPSKEGTTLYKLQGKYLSRVTRGDDIIDMKCLSNNKMLVVSMSHDGYNYTIQTAIKKNTQIPSIHYSFENTKDEHLFDTSDLDSNTSVSSKQKYHPIMNLHYSSLNQSTGIDNDGFIGTFNLQFSDPLMQNNLNLFGSTSSQFSLFGLGYDNSAHKVHFGGSVVGIFNQTKIEDEDKNFFDEYRDYGYTIYAQYPFLHTGYWYGDIKLDYSVPYSTLFQKPLTASLSLSRKEQYGLSKYPHSLHDFSLFGSSDRSNITYGIGYQFMHSLINQSYIGFNTTYMKSEISNTKNEKGIAISNDKNTFEFMPNKVKVLGIEKDYFANEVFKNEVGLYKVFDGSVYFFSFPLSLQRETIYIKERLYDIKTEDASFTYNESVIGLGLDLLVYHSISVPLELEWVHNKDVKNKDRFNIQFSTSF